MAFYDHYIKKDYKPFSIYLKKSTHRKLFSIIRNLSSFEKVLEIGVGGGYWGEICKLENIEYVGLESNSILCRQLRSKGLTPVQAWVPTLPFKSETFDLVFSSHVIEHLRDGREVFDFISEIRRVLKNKGLICIVVPDYLKLGRIFWDSDYTHSFITTKKRIEQILQDAEMEILLSRSYTGSIFGPTKYFLNLLLGIYDSFCFQLLFAPLVRRKLCEKIRMTFVQSVVVIAEKNG